MVEKVPMTPGGFVKLQEELRWRQQEERPRIIEAIAEARAHGERGFDFANIFANEELPVITDPARFRRQLAIVSAEAKLEPKRLLQWIAAYSGLSAAWFLGDPNIQQAETALTVARIALAELES